MSRIALVHSVSLAGKEVADRLAQRPDLCTDLRLYALDEAMVGTLTEGLDGAAFVARVEEGCFDGVDLTILCGEIELDRQALQHRGDELRQHQRGGARDAGGGDELDRREEQHR